MFEDINDQIDVQKNKLMTMEHFIDKYIPIRIQQQIGETLNTVGTRTILQKLEKSRGSRTRSEQGRVMKIKTQSKGVKAWKLK